MEVDEVRISKISSELHKNISEQIKLNINSPENITLQPLLTDIHQFLPCPHLLNQKLPEYVRLIAQSYIDHPVQSRKWVPEVFYTFGKIVSAKTLLNYFETDIKYLPMLIGIVEDNEGMDWQEEYLLLCWLCVLVLVPFKLELFNDDIPERLFKISLRYLDRPDPIQSLAARLLASFIMRNDFVSFRDAIFKKVFEEYAESSSNLQNGYLTTINISLQKDTLFELNKYPIFEFISSNEIKNSIIVIKIYSKLFQYFLLEINDDQVDDQYEKIEEIISFFFKNMDNSNTDYRYIIARKFVKVISKLDSCTGIDVILDIYDEIFKILDMNNDDINADLLHSYLLTLAELLRLELTFDFKSIDKILSSTLFFQQCRLTFIAGGNIRDASAFICWSLFKYNKEIPANISYNILSKLLLVCCFDKDIMIRRACTAAVQELLGRQGNAIWKEMFPNENNDSKNIELIEVLDYVELGSIEKSFTKIVDGVLTVCPFFKTQFIKFLTGNVFNTDNELSKLSCKTLTRLLSTDQTDNIIDEILLAPSKVHIFYCLSQLLPLSSTHYSEVVEIFENTEVNHHKDSKFKLISYMSLLNTLIKQGYKAKEFEINNLFNIIRVDDGEICQILNEISKSIELDKSSWEKWLFYVRNNNYNCAYSIGNLLNEDNYKQVITILNNIKIDATIRSVVVQSLAKVLPKLQYNDLIDTLVRQLDDYTISEQGDVGSKIRLSVLRLVDSNFKLFSKNEDLERKLLRVSCETIDTLRNEAFNLLCRMKNDYDLQLLDLYQKYYIDDEVSSKEFWKGYIFSGGAVKSTDEMIMNSINNFMEFYDNLSPATQTKILLIILSNLRVDTKDANEYQKQRLLKNVMVGLNFLSRILQLNLSIPDGFNMRGFYVRIHNLQLNNKNVTRIGYTIKIMSCLYLNHGNQDSYNRLVQLLKHDIIRVRQISAQELFLILTIKEQFSVLNYLKEINLTNSNLQIIPDKFLIKD